MRRAARPLLYLGVVVIVFGLGQVHATFIGHYEFTGTSRFGWTFAYAAVLCVLAYAFGLPDAYRTRREALGPAVGAAFLGAAAMSLIQLFVGDALLPRLVVFGSALILPDWYRLCVSMSLGGRSRAEARDRAIVVASPTDSIALEEELREAPERPAVVVLSLTPEQAVGPANEQPLLDALVAYAPTVLVLDREAQDVQGVVSQAGELHERGVRVRSMTLFYEEWLGKLPMAELERASLLFDIGEVHRAGYGRAKRLLDLPLAVVGAALLVIVVPFVFAGNLIGNRGPLFYRQVRVGKHGVPFTILKLRTMVPDVAAAAVDQWTAERDPRVTSFGRILRVTHIDELPQVINVLKGDLSIVGPRPEQPHYVEELAQKLPFYQLRHLVRPGLTGWAQVKYGYAGSESDALEKLQYEFWYLRHQGVGTDLRIIGRTLRSVFGSQGRGR
jgi:lipopolysaccharide/colanic/teichoic acid biosynthesis glycosyltransferase